jgi:hypothetical protein
MRSTWPKHLLQKYIESSVPHHRSAGSALAQRRVWNEFVADLEPLESRMLIVSSVLTSLKVCTRDAQSLSFQGRGSNDLPH